METSAPRGGIRRRGRFRKGLSRPIYATGRIDIVRRRRLVPLLAVSLMATLAPALATSTASAAPAAAAPSVASSYAAPPSVALPSAAQGAALDRYTKQKPRWKRCASTAPAEFQCATIKVPLDYRAPGGKRIDLAISRIRTAEPGKRHGVLLSNPGGPGGSGTYMPLALREELPKSVLRKYDLIGFDPRGVGGEQPGHLRPDTGRGGMAAAVQEGDVRQGRRLGAQGRGQVPGEGGRHPPAHHHPQHRPRPGPAPGGPRRAEDLLPRILVRHLSGRRLHPALPRPRRPVRAGQRGRSGARLAGHGPVVGVGRRARVRPVDRVGRRAFGDVRPR
ncbi:exported protein of unknown function [Streptomyces sp. KY75]|nr:exported protein of unknown function [Streptomyces sp. KY70]CAD5992935.1 exported protein of unknown function [Streptomyces sp. KY75]